MRSFFHKLTSLFQSFCQKAKVTPLLWLIPAGAVMAVTALIFLFILLLPAKVSDGYDFSLEEAQLYVPVQETVQINTRFDVINEKKAKHAASALEALKIRWESSDESILTVDEKGLVTALQPGTATVTASFEKVSASCQVTVYIPIEEISFQEKEISCRTGQRLKLSYAVKPAEASDAGDLKYHSSNTGVATVDRDGTLTAYYPGETTITLTTGNLEASCHVTVTAPLQGISLNKEELELLGGDTVQLNVNYDPGFTTDSRVTAWSTTDEAVAAVSPEGLLTAVGPGDATITASVGSFQASCKVHVTVPMTGISFSFQSLTIRNGDSVSLPLSYQPWNTSDDKTTTWTSSNQGIIKVNDQGAVTAVGAGTATVTAACNDFEATCQITVVIPVTAVNISHTSLALTKGASAQLGASVAPANTTESPAISWASDNTSVATVSGGTVTAVGPGTATIVASHDAVSAACVVTVTSPLAGISFDQSALQIIDGFSAPLSINYQPADTTDNRDAAWSSDNPDVATVSDGIVTAVSVGTCHITAVVGEFSASAEVTVTPYVAVESITLNTNALTFDAAGAQAALSASIAPADASVTRPNWSSSNTSVATVSGDGIVTARGSGTATITASAGGQSASCTVTVLAANKIVVLDPGHDSTHTGAYYNGRREEQMSLVVANACKAYLESHYNGVTVYLTRTSGAALHANLKQDLEARAQYAQNVNADILVSLHFNATGSHSASGSLCFVSKQANVASASSALARSILSRICSATGLLNRGPVSSSSDQYFDEFGNPLDYYAINRHCANRGIPGIIVEHCFMDVDTQWCDTDAKLQQFGVWDAQGIAGYLGLSAK